MQRPVHDLAEVFGSYLARWRLMPEGDPITTPTGHLLPVLHCGAPAMLKVATEAEEKTGNALMVAWNGQGAARVLAHDTDAVLLERANAGSSLADLARAGRDDEATEIICGVVARVHAAAVEAPPVLVPLERWFEGLGAIASANGGVLVRSAITARELLAVPRDVRVLHGDVHHGNVLHFGEQGWLAIDPKGLIPSRSNPDLLQVGVAGQAVEPFGGELVPSGA